jgi:hypothetical protein
MIHHIISVINTQLNEYIRNELNISEEMVIVSSLMDIKGNANMQIENKVCLFLQNIEEEKIAKSGGFQANAGMAPPMYVNLYLVFAANFPDPNYIESLRYVSMIIEFFQGHSVFDRSNTPMLSSNIDKVTLDYVNLDFNELNNLWSLVGAKYIPSAVYKMRMLTFNQHMIREDVPGVIQGIDALDGIASNLRNKLLDSFTTKPEEGA